MAHFFGVAMGRAKSHASRLGTKDSGIHVYAASWDGRITLHLWHDAQAGVDRFEVHQEYHQGAGVSEPLARGIVGQRQIQAVAAE